jgi:hypothetical protein
MNKTWKSGFRVENGGKNKSWPNGRPAVGGLTGERPAVGRGGGWWGSDGWRWCVVFFWTLGRM